MNRQEKTLLIAAAALLLVFTGLRLTHQPEAGQAFITLAFVLGVAAHRRYANRLKVRNQELEAEIATLHQRP